MNVSVDITRRDLFAVAFQLLFRLRGNYWFMLVLGCTMFVYLCIERDMRSVGEFVVAAFASVMAALGGLLGGFLVNFACMLLAANKDGGVLGMHKLSISPMGFSEATAVNDSHHTWSGIKSISRLRNHIVILMKSQAVHIVPRRAFASSVEFESFFAHATALKNAADVLPPECEQV